VIVINGARTREAHPAACATPLCWELAQSLGRSAEVKDLLVRRGGVLEVDPVNIAHLLAEPHVEGVLRGSNSGEYGLQVIGFDVDDRQVAGRSVRNRRWSFVWFVAGPLLQRNVVFERLRDAGWWLPGHMVDSTNDHRPVRTVGMQHQFG